ncbi:MAG: fibronectin type III domain-containing protein [bacterium]|nr:fibronectin type III domain-containing protein [bacterium]
MKRTIILSLVIFLGLAVALPTFAIGQASQPVINEKFTNEITVFWPDVAGATKYKVKLYTRKGKLKAANTVINSGATIKKPLKSNRSYKIKVRAIDAQGNRGAWSPYKKFTTRQKRFYHNKKYNFSLDLPKTWEGFKVKKVSTWDGAEIEFKLYSQTEQQWYSMFTVWLTDYTEYAKCPDCYLGELLGYTNDHAYLYVHAQDTALDLGARAQEMDGIVYTFNFDSY